MSDLPASLNCLPGRALEARDPGSRLIDRTRSRIRPLSRSFRDGKGREEWSWSLGGARGLSPTYGWRSWPAVHHPGVSGVPASLHMRSRPSAAGCRRNVPHQAAREPGSSPLAVGHHAVQSVAIKIPNKTAVADFPGTRGERVGARWSWLSGRARGLDPTYGWRSAGDASPRRERRALLLPRVPGQARPGCPGTTYQVRARAGIFTPRRGAPRSPIRCDKDPGQDRCRGLSGNAWGGLSG